MPIQEILLNKLKCSLKKYGHRALEPITLKCGATDCKECINSLEDLKIHCYSWLRSMNRKIHWFRRKTILLKRSFNFQ